MSKQVPAAHIWSMRRVSRKTDRIRVLVVDDSRSTADSLCAYLEDRGMRTKVAYGGSAAFKTAAVSRPDVIVMDVSMPGIDGYDVAQSLRANDATWDIAIVAHTAQEEKQVREKTLNFEFDAFCSKRSGFKALIEVIEALAPSPSPLPAIPIRKIVDCH